jgi:hypothetical protein
MPSCDDSTADLMCNKHSCDHTAPTSQSHKLLRVWWLPLGQWGMPRRHSSQRTVRMQQQSVDTGIEQESVCTDRGVVTATQTAGAEVSAYLLSSVLCMVSSNNRVCRTCSRHLQCRQAYADYAWPVRGCQANIGTTSHMPLGLGTLRVMKRHHTDSALASHKLPSSQQLRYQACSAGACRSQPMPEHCT